MYTLEELRLHCGWSKNEMARQAGIDINTLNKALKGQLISIGTADKLAVAISKKLERHMSIMHINGLNVKDLNPTES